MRPFRIAFGVLAALEAVGLFATFPQETGALVAYPVLALWVAGTLLLIVDRFPAVGGGAVAVAGLAVIFITPGLFYSHRYLIIVIGVILALFAREHQPVLLRAQLSVVYGFAALAKVNPAYLSGDVLEHWLGRSPLFGDLAVPTLILVALAVSSVACEAFLAVGFWFERTRVVAVGVGIAFHVAILFVLSQYTLVVYGGLMFALYWFFFDRSREPDQVGEPAVPSAQAR